MKFNSESVLLEDDELVVIDKPAGLPTIPGRQGGPSLRDLLTEHLHGAAPLVVHRLDRDTSGVLIFARTAAAHRMLCEQLGQRRVVKEYLAIIRGCPLQDEGLIDAPLAKHARIANRMVVASDPNKGKPAQTRWLLIERFRGISLLRCFPLTGRQHQIRVHLLHIGLPLLVDKLYTGSDAFRLSEIKSNYRPSGHHEERPLIARLTLHAEALTFTHPRSGEPLRVEAPPPKDFRSTLAQLRKLSR